MKNFKAGDRVHVYGAGWHLDNFNEAVQSPWKAVVKNIDFEMLNVVRDYDSVPHAVYPQQCRRLRKRERITLFAGQNKETLCVEVDHYSGSFPQDKLVEFIEVRRK